MPSEPRDELAIQHIVTRIKTIQGSPTYHTTLKIDNVVRNFKNPLKAPDDNFPLVQVIGTPSINFVQGTATRAGGDWNRISDIQVNTDVLLFLAVIGEDSYTQLLRLRDDINRVLSNDFNLGGNVKDWFPVNLEAGYAWESQSRYMGTAIYTIRLIWTYNKQSP